MANTAVRFLEANENVSGPITPDGGTASGGVIIQFNGTMAADEKWAIEQAEYNADPNALVWQAVHTTDFLLATHAPGATNQNATVDRWGGARDGNRVFEVPTAKGYLYRVRLVFKSNTSQNAAGTAITNSTVTASWGEVRVKDWFS